MHSNRVWTGWQSLIVALALTGASTAWAQAAPPQSAPAAPPPPGAPVAPSAPGVNGQAPPPAYPAPPQAYPAQPAPQQAYPVQGGYPPGQGYPPPQQGYPPPAQAYPAQPPQQAYPQQGYAPQQPAPYQQPYYSSRTPRPRRPSRGLMITGASILGGSYLISALVGGILIDEDNDYGDCNDCRQVGRWLFLPVVGPWVAMKDTRDDGGLAFLGLLQLVGTGLTVGGIVRFVNTKREIESGLASWQLKGDRKLTLDVTSSPLLVGPRMHLQF
jgi:hypothetical protein